MPRITTATLTLAIASVVGPAAGQSLTVPAGTEIQVRATAPIDGARDDAGARFAGVLADDVIVEFLLVAKAGDPCSGMVAVSDAGIVTLELTSVRTATGMQSITATDPQLRHDPKPPPRVVGFAGAVAASDGGATRASAPHLRHDGRISVPANALLVFRLTRPFTLPLGETVSLFPQPENPAPTTIQSAAVTGWVAPPTLKQPQHDPRRSGHGRRGRRGVGSRRGAYGPWASGGSFYGSVWSNPGAQPLEVLTPSNRGPGGRPITAFPAGTLLVTRTSEPIDSSKVQPGAPFRSTLMTDLVANGIVIVPRGSPANGIVTVGKAGEVLLPTVALTGLLLGTTERELQTGAVQVLHAPAPRLGPVGIGGAASAGARANHEQPEDAASVLRLAAGTILEFALARPLIVD